MSKTFYVLAFLFIYSFTASAQVFPKGMFDDYELSTPKLGEFQHSCEQANSQRSEAITDLPGWLREFPDSV
jgi:hypothetical protein